MHTLPGRPLLDTTTVKRSTADDLSHLARPPATVQKHLQCVLDRFAKELAVE